MNWIELATELRAIRKAKKISIVELCNRTGMDKAQISRFENGMASITLDTYIKMLNAMNLTINIR